MILLCSGQRLLRAVEHIIKAVFWTRWGRPCGYVLTPIRGSPGSEDVQRVGKVPRGFYEASKRVNVGPFVRAVGRLTPKSVLALFVLVGGYVESDGVSYRNEATLKRCWRGENQQDEKKRDVSYVQVVFLYCINRQTKLLITFQNNRDTYSRFSTK